MRRTIPTILTLLVVALCGLMPATASAAPRRPLRPTHIGGDLGIRPFIGVTADLWDDDGDFGVLGGSRFTFGADLVIGPGTGLAPVAGIRLGTGAGGFTMEPVFEAHYRFETPIPLVPWVGAGAGLKIGFDSRSFAMALGFRLVFGAEYFLTDTVSIGTQLTIPDVGPRLVSSSSRTIAVGNVEWIFGSQIRF